MKCPACKTEIPDDSKFGLSCGSPTKEEGIDMILPPDGSNTESRATMYMMFAIMSLFFGFFLLIPGFLVGWGLVVPSVGLIIVGFALVLARYRLLRRYAQRVEKFRQESAIRVRCRYCGALNPQNDEKCMGCGAPLT